MVVGLQFLSSHYQTREIHFPRTITARADSGLRLTGNSPTSSSLAGLQPVLTGLEVESELDCPTTSPMQLQTINRPLLPKTDERVRSAGWPRRDFRSSDTSSEMITTHLKSFFRLIDHLSLLSLKMAYPANDFSMLDNNSSDVSYATTQNSFAASDLVAPICHPWSHSCY